MAEITMRQAISDALREEMERDEKVFIMGEEVGVWGGTYAVTKGFYDQFGEKRVRDTPITESAFIGAAVGLLLILVFLGWLVRRTASRLPRPRRPWPSRSGPNIFRFSSKKSFDGMDRAAKCGTGRMP